MSAPRLLGLSAARRPPGPRARVPPLPVGLTVDAPAAPGAEHAHAHAYRRLPGPRPVAMATPAGTLRRTPFVRSPAPVDSSDQHACIKYQSAAAAPRSAPPQRGPVRERNELQGGHAAHFENPVDNKHRRRRRACPPAIPRAHGLDCSIGGKRHGRRHTGRNGRAWGMLKARARLYAVWHGCMLHEAHPP